MKGEFAWLHFWIAKKYSSLDELNETYKPNNPDILYMQMKYGKNVSFQRIMYPLGTYPRFELKCFRIS